MAEGPLIYEIVSRKSALPPLDAALEYLRERPMRVLPLYLVAMAPMSVGVFLLIDAVTSGHRGALPESAHHGAGLPGDPHLAQRDHAPGAARERAHPDAHGRRDQ